MFCEEKHEIGPHGLLKWYLATIVLNGICTTEKRPLSLWNIITLTFHCGVSCHAAITPQNRTMVWLWFWMWLIVILEVWCCEDISAARFVSPYTTGLGCTPRYASAFLSLSSLTMLLISPRKHVWRDKEWRKPTTSGGEYKRNIYNFYDESRPQFFFYWAENCFWHLKTTEVIAVLWECE